MSIELNDAIIVIARLVFHLNEHTGHNVEADSWDYFWKANTAIQVAFIWTTGIETKVLALKSLMVSFPIAIFFLLILQKEEWRSAGKKLNDP